MRSCWQISCAKAGAGDCAACRRAVAAFATVDDGAGANPGADDTEAPRERYELLRLLATGGMGEVFLGRDKLLGRDVAIKLLHEDDTSPEARRWTSRSRPGSRAPAR